MLSSLGTTSTLLLAVASAFRPPSTPATFPVFGRASPLTMSVAGPFPELCVFDLDACFWDQEMYCLTKIPDQSSIVKGDLNGRGEGVAGVMSGRSRIALHAGSLAALQAQYDSKYPGMRVCFASSADTPLAEQIGRAALKLLEVVPGTTVWDLVVGRDWDGEDVNQIGRQPPLSANKSATHFPRLRELTRVRYDRMLFFDDCQWGDHCGQVERACTEQETGRGPVTVRTPLGLGMEEWAEGLEKYAEKYRALDGADNYDIKK